MFSIVFTMNDTGYWGMIPSLAKTTQDRNKLTSTTALFANFGGIIAGILIPILTTGNLAIGGSSITAYAWLSVIFVILFIVFPLGYPGTLPRRRCSPRRARWSVVRSPTPARAANR